MISSLLVHRLCTLQCGYETSKKKYKPVGSKLFQEAGAPLLFCEFWPYKGPVGPLKRWLIGILLAIMGSVMSYMGANRARPAYIGTQIFHGLGQQMCERIICDNQTNTIKYDFPAQSFAKGSWDTFPFGDPSSHGCVLKETHVPLPSPLPQGNVGLVDADQWSEGK